jgi:hypothetical protein
MQQLQRVQQQELPLVPQELPLLAPQSLGKSFRAIRFLQL